MTAFVFVFLLILRARSSNEVPSSAHKASTKFKASPPSGCEKKKGKPKKDQARSTRNERQRPQGSAVAPPGGHKASEHKGATDARGTKSHQKPEEGGEGSKPEPNAKTRKAAQLCNGRNKHIKVSPNLLPNRYSFLDNSQLYSCVMQSTIGR